MHYCKSVQILEGVPVCLVGQPSNIKPLSVLNIGPLLFLVVKLISWLTKGFVSADPGKQRICSTFVSFPLQVDFFASILQSLTNKPIQEQVRFLLSGNDLFTTQVTKFALAAKKI